MSHTAPINQKEYLSKYLGKGTHTKKRRKKKASEMKNVTIIDDDVVDDMLDLADMDQFEANEYAPQIVAVVDERPPSMRIDEHTKDNLWKPIGVEREESSIGGTSVNKFKINKSVASNIITHYIPKGSSKKLGSIKDIADSSPPRKQKNYSQDSSPPRKSNNSFDSSPPRKRKPEEVLVLNRSPPRQNAHSYYNSPPRKLKLGDADIKPIMEDMKQIAAPPDQSPTRRRRYSSDSSPPRKPKSDDRIESCSSRQIGTLPDQSPPRRRRHSSDSSPPRKRQCDDKTRQIGTLPDQSPPRRRRHSSDSSPPRKRQCDDKTKSYSRSQISTSQDQSPKRRRRHSSDGSPARKEQFKDSDGKMKKTLDGKRAGLQKASELVTELQQFKKREDELFSRLSAEASGQNAKAVVRDRKTGKIRDLKEEAVLQQQKEQQERKRKEKYSRWGRGLKQVEDSGKKLADTLHEASKPLARYANDEDLETYLKEKEMPEDPMLMYIRQKKRNKAIEEPNYTEKPEYMGEFMPNRYGIRPGHRWDGVDRSNGYESKFFQVQNERTAQREESYKWCTEDM